MPAVKAGTQGGLSDEVFRATVMQEYLRDQSPLFGYVGDHHRTHVRDRAAEAALRAVGLTADEVATFLTWKVGRWLADAMSGCMGPDEHLTAAAKFLAGRDVAKTIREITGREPAQPEHIQLIDRIARRAKMLAEEARKQGADAASLARLKQIDHALGAFINDYFSR